LAALADRHTEAHQAALQSDPPPADQVKDQDDQSDYQQKVDQTTGYVQAETQKPQNQNDDKDCPEHMHSFSALRAPETGDPAQAHPTHSQTAVNSMQWPAPLLL
jgi:hypothetical protein